MVDDREWATYLALQDAGPVADPGSTSRARPWGHGRLRAPDLGGAAMPAMLNDLLAHRRSDRNLTTPLTLAQLCQLLGLVLSPSAPGRRRYPTSGGCDELGVLVVARSVEGLEPGAYWAVDHGGQSFHRAAPLDHRFERFETQCLPFLGLTPAAPPAATLLVFAAWARLTARYRHCVLASALWDCGALLQTVSLAATALALPACVCACVQPVLVEAWLDLPCRDVGHIGTMMLGGSPNTPGGSDA